MSKKKKTKDDTIQQVNANAQAQQAAAQAQQTQIIQQQMLPSAAQKRFDTGAEEWDKFKAGKDYSKPPAGDFLGFDLMNPANAQKQSARMGALEGIGALGLGGGSGDSGGIALGLARERNANIAGEQAGAAYENAVGSRNAYWEGNALPYMAQEQNKQANLLSNASNNAQFYSGLRGQTIPQPKPSILGSIFGAALTLGGAYLGGPGGAQAGSAIGSSLFGKKPASA